MRFSFGAATAAIFLASSLMAQDGSDPNAPKGPIPGEAPASKTSSPQGAGVVLPNAFATKMGNYNNIFGVAWANQRYQQQHTAASVGNAKPFFGHAMRFRNATHTGPTQRLDIRVSNCATTPSTHNMTFATNIGNNTQTSVFNGTYTYPNMTPNTDPTSFQIILPWTAPWPWVPANGGLLVEVRNRSTSNGSYFVDAASGDASVARSWAHPGADAPVAIRQDGNGLIYCLFDKPIPPFATFDTYGKGCPGTGGKVGVILPASMRTRIGSSNNIFGSAWPNQRYHQLFTGGQVGPTRLFKNHALRPGSRRDTGPTVRMTITMFESDVAPSGISTSFATNIGNNSGTVVFNGTQNYPNMIPSTNPAEFKILVAWTTRFLWKNTAGKHLLYQYQTPPQTRGSYFPNAHSGDSNTARMWSNAGPNAVSGSRQTNYGVVMCFGYDGRGSATPELSNNGRPVTGKSFDITVSQAQSNPGIAVLIMGVSKTTWNTIPLPWNLTPLGAKDCFLNASFDLITGTTLDANGNGKVTFAVPNAAGLYGLTWHNQYFVFDAAANVLGLVFTNGGTAVIGGL